MEKQAEKTTKRIDQGKCGMIKKKEVGMSQKQRWYLCIDLKSFYASVECVERGLDPLTTNLVVADRERTDRTICLAISPPMKELGVENRCRLFQIPEYISYITAPPRMQLYIDYSANIYSIYLKYIAKEDIHVYSIDEAFMDVTDYLSMYQMTAEELGIRIMKDILETTGISSACGVGTNLYLAKIALDILAKHSSDHIAILEEESYRDRLWEHKPLSDFWRVGAGTARRLENMGICTMKGIAEAEESVLYQLFGVDAELLIDHAWGREDTLISDIKAYRPKKNSISSGQVLACDYNFEDARLIVREMADLLALDLVDQGLVTNSITLHIGYSYVLNKKPAHGTTTMSVTTNSARKIIAATEELYGRVVEDCASIRRITVTFNNVVSERCQQYDLFTDPAEMERENRIQKAVLEMKKKFGKNAVLKGMNLEEKGTTRERNRQIGGHRSGV